ncbi:hypothetical protein FQN54_007392 [Arachnomyces sp. PD_36]|nr:hypothetical protein FQN54_007392 [Arachnomyces sp. PD_36]
MTSPPLREFPPPLHGYPNLSGPPRPRHQPFRLQQLLPPHSHRRTHPYPPPHQHGPRKQPAPPEQPILPEHSTPPQPSVSTQASVSSKNPILPEQNNIPQEHVQFELSTPLLPYLRYSPAVDYVPPEDVVREPSLSVGRWPVGVMDNTTVTGPMAPSPAPADQTPDATNAEASSRASPIQSKDLPLGPPPPPPPSTDPSAPSITGTIAVTDHMVPCPTSTDQNPYVTNSKPLRRTNRVTRSQTKRGSGSGALSPPQAPEGPDEEQEEPVGLTFPRFSFRQISPVSLRDVHYYHKIRRISRDSTPS